MLRLTTDAAVSHQLAPLALGTTNFGAAIIVARPGPCFDLAFRAAIAFAVARRVVPVPRLITVTWRYVLFLVVVQPVDGS